MNENKKIKKTEEEILAELEAMSYSKIMAIPLSGKFKNASRFIADMKKLWEEVIK